MGGTQQEEYLLVEWKEGEIGADQDWVERIKWLMILNSWEKGTGGIRGSNPAEIDGFFFQNVKIQSTSRVQIPPSAIFLVFLVLINWRNAKKRGNLAEASKEGYSSKKTDDHGNYRIKFLKEIDFPIGDSRNTNSLLFIFYFLILSIGF